MKRIRTLGGLGVFDESRPLAGNAQQPRRLAVLAVLARAGDRGVSRDRLALLLWPEVEEERGRKSLNQALYALRQELGSEEAILGTRDLRLNAELIETDLAAFESAASSGALEDAARLYAGPFLGDFNLPGAAAFAHWAEQERDSLAADYRRLLESVALAAANRGDWGSAVNWWRRLAALDPTDAAVAQGLMRALAASGDVPAALRHEEIFTALRQQEMELPPDPGTRDLARRIRAGELPPVRRPSRPVETPTIPSTKPATVRPRAPEARPPTALSVAVLPFVNMTPDRENEYFSDGLTEELTSALVGVAGLRVVSRTSAFAFKGKDIDAREIGQRLGVSHLIEGSVRKIGNRIRVTAQIVSSLDGYHLWSHAFDRTLTDVFELQQEIASAVVLALGSTAPAPLGLPQVTPRTEVVAAYTMYLRGRYFANKRTTDSLRTALEYFDQAIELDSHYALAHAGVAECWALLGFEEFGDQAPLQVMPQAKAALIRALKLDPLLPEGHLWLGVIAFLFEYDRSEARARFARAIELKSAAPLHHAWLALLEGVLGRYEASIAEALQAERLDPVSMTMQFVVGRCYAIGNRHEEALQRFLAIQVADKKSIASAWTARSLLAMGRTEEALGTLEAALPTVGRHPLMLEVLGSCLAILGRQREARAIIAELEQLAQVRHVSAYHRGAILSYLGEPEATTVCLAEAIRQRSGYIAFATTLGANPPAAWLLPGSRTLLRQVYGAEA